MRVAWQPPLLYLFRFSFPHVVGETTSISLVLRALQRGGGGARRPVLQDPMGLKGGGGWVMRTHLVRRSPPLLHRLFRRANHVPID